MAESQRGYFCVFLCKIFTLGRKEPLKLVIIFFLVQYYYYSSSRSSVGRAPGRGPGFVVGSSPAGCTIIIIILISEYFFIIFLWYVCAFLSSNCSSFIIMKLKNKHDRVFLPCWFFIKSWILVQYYPLRILILSHLELIFIDTSFQSINILIWSPFLVPNINLKVILLVSL